MGSFLTSIFSIIMALIMQTSTMGTAAVSPEDAATEFMEGLSAGNDQVVVKYMENDYVNLLENTGNDKTTDRLYKGLFRNFGYEITDSASKNDVAVVKMTVTNSDFSNVEEDFNEAAYQYITGNLYDEDVTNKKKLSKECLDIYIEQIEKTAEEGKTKDKTIFLPMRSNGYYGWEVLVDDKIMKRILGGLKIPK